MKPRCQRTKVLAAVLALGLLWAMTPRLEASNGAFLLGAEVARLMNARVHQVLFLSVSESTRDAGGLGEKLSTLEGMGFRRGFSEQLLRDLPKAGQIVAACASAVDQSIERICQTCVQSIRDGDQTTTDFLFVHVSDTNVGLLADENLRGALKPMVARLGARVRFLKRTSESPAVRDRCDAFLEKLDDFRARQLDPIREDAFRAAALNHFAAR